MSRSPRPKLAIGCLSSVVTIVLLIAISILVMRSRFEARFNRVERHLNSNAASLADAVRSVTSANAPGSRSDILPSALAAPDVKFAIFGESHVTLVVRTSPDTMSGFRVWLKEPTDEFSDRATTTPGVFRFSYCNDFPTSPSNRPD